MSDSPNNQKTYLPLVGNAPQSAPPNGKRLIIDPLTRIEGHLRIEAQVVNGKVSDAWSAGTMFRGIEPILKGRDPRDAWAFTQRLCGVCTTVHAIASVRAVENALGITVPDNARLIRNLMEAAQYVQDHVIHFYHLHALDWQREYIKFQALLGGKNPHPQVYLVGGMATPVDPTSAAAINPARVTTLKSLAAKGLDFVTRVYLPDLLLIASFYKEWAQLGGGLGNFLSYGDFPQDNSGQPGALYLPQGVILNKDIGHAPLPVNAAQIKEYVTHSWYSYTQGDGAGLHPSQGETTPNFTGPQPPYEALDVESKYSWLKAPRYNEQPMEVGPLARMLVAYATGHSRVKQLTDQALAKLGLPASALFSTLGRVAARGIETQVIAEQMDGWLSQLESNIGSGNLAIHNGAKWSPTTWPADTSGMGMTEAPRGALGHWVHINNGKIQNYQMVVPTTWNGSPRDGQGQRGIYETALIGIPLADPERPVEILRTIHSFDPCMACAVHVIDAAGEAADHTTLVRVHGG